MTFKINSLPDADRMQIVPYTDRPASQSPCSVIMVSYHTGPVLVESLRAALTQAQVSEVILVDNGNNKATLDSLRALAQDDGRLKIITGHGNVGFARGCNIGARRATGDHLLLLNPDCVLRPGVIRRGTEVFANNPDAAALTVRIENLDGSEQRGGRRNLMTPYLPGRAVSAGPLDAGSSVFPADEPERDGAV